MTSRVQDKRSSFCKLILQIEPVKHLRIPPDFSRLYHCELPDSLILKGPSGNNWPAKLRRDLDFMYLQDDGWQNFHIDNALGHGEFLVFQYDGKDCFEVQVFNPTGLERLYVAGAKTTRTSIVGRHRSRGRPRKHPVGSRNLPLLKSPKSQGNHNPELEQNKLEKTQMEESLRKREEEMDLPDVRMSSESGKQQNKNRPDFFKVYRPEHSSQRMQIPRAYLVWLDKLLSGEIILTRRSGRRWHVKVIVEAEDAYLEDGWQKFMRDNLVKTNDVVVFSHQGHSVFSVKLYGHSTCEKQERALPEEVGEGSEVPAHNRDHDRDYEEEEEEEEPEDSRKRSKGEGNVGETRTADKDPIDVEQYIDAKNPYFVTTVRAFRKSYLYVPSAVRNGYELHLPQTIEFQVPNGRTWRGEVKVWKDNRIWISGWGALCRHYNLKVNTRCICELLEKKGVIGRIVKVHIIRGHST